MMNLELTLGDGRILCVHEFGDTTGQPVVFLHGGGAGATGRFAAFCDSAANELGLRILAPDRPGLGGSSPKNKRTVLDWPDDVARMADLLSIATFPVVAHSGGAPYALASAWRLPDRVASVHLVSAMLSPGLVREDISIPRRTKLEMWFLSAMPRWLLATILGRISKGMERNPEKTGQAFLKTLPPCERSALAAPATLQILRDSVRSAFQQGTSAVIDDLHLIFGEWGVALGEVRQRVTMWHGECDRTSPPQLASALGRMLPASELRLVSDAGHLSVWGCHAREVLGRVAQAQIEATAQKASVMARSRAARSDDPPPRSSLTGCEDVRDQHSKAASHRGPR